MPTRHRAAAPLLGGAAALLIVLAAAPTALGHGGSAGIVVEPGSVNPGGVVVVRGDGLGADASMRLRLAGSAGVVDLAQVTTDQVGHLTAAVAVPVDLPVGRYSIEAVSEVGDIVAGPMVVDGPPIVPDEGGVRDEDEPLLVALPPGWQQSLSSPPTTATPVTSGDAGPARAITDFAPLFVPPAVAVGLLLWLGRRRRATP